MLLAGPATFRIALHLHVELLGFSRPSCTLRRENKSMGRLLPIPVSVVSTSPPTFFFVIKKKNQPCAVLLHSCENLTFLLHVWKSNTRIRGLQTNSSLRRINWVILSFSVEKGSEPLAIASHFLFLISGAFIKTSFGTEIFFFFFVCLKFWVRFKGKLLKVG